MRSEFGAPQCNWTYDGADPLYWSIWRQIQSNPWEEMESILGSLRSWTDSERAWGGSDATGYKVQVVIEGGGGPYSNVVYIETDPI